MEGSINCILDLDSPSYPPMPQEYEQCAARGCKSCIEYYIKYLEEIGMIASDCKTCQEQFYPAIRAGKKWYEVCAPRHKAQDRCRSGKYPHCTCDTCF